MIRRCDSAAMVPKTSEDFPDVLRSGLVGCAEQAAGQRLPLAGQHLRGVRTGTSRRYIPGEPVPWRF
ncbi:MAG: hypothetical protein LC799_12615 [Actinobacteria bacterium]|nr:hypothetical protein [Actinomycetota bacterium]